jgi:uncharacterized protein
METQPSWARHAPVALTAIGLLLPTVSLLPFGSLWLWEHGFLFHWAIATCFSVAVAYLLQRRWLKHNSPTEVPAPPIGLPDDRDDSWSMLQNLAWDDINVLAAAAAPSRLASRDEAIGLAVEAIDTVARRLHPERRDPLLQFTVPEALNVIERASTNLRTHVASAFPMGDRVTLAQLMFLFRWRGALSLIEKGYGLWRIVRLLNPVTAATQEVRDRLTRQIYELGREQLLRRLLRLYVREIGRAAVDLYGGNLRVTKGMTSVEPLLDTHKPKDAGPNVHVDPN